MATILVVDDNRDARDLTQLHLAQAGHRVLTAEDALVAGRMLLARAPDLLIVDAGLPYLSGQDFVAALLADSTIPWVPVVFLTGDSSFADRAAALQAEFLLKPCPAPKLVEMVAKLLAKSRRATAVAAHAGRAASPQRAVAPAGTKPSLLI